ncbi:MAG: hypothetical protein II975_09465 [Bacteroidales bacterium]|nr:hypothetical protein [Bacteroidales bacterium]
MKKYIIAIILCILFWGCVPVVDMGFTNNANYKISIYSNLIPPHDYSNPVVYPDTTLPYSKSPQMRDVEAGRSCVYSQTSATIEQRYAGYNTDTISIFVFSFDTLNSFGWDAVRNTYNVLQRYDISILDYNSLSDFPTFPPSEEMRNIKMWPPYGTYDENGHRVKP